MKATEVTAGLTDSNGSLLPGLWRDSLHVTCGLTACTPGSAPGPTLDNQYGKTLPFFTRVRVPPLSKVKRYKRPSYEPKVRRNAWAAGALPGPSIPPDLN